MLPTLVAGPALAAAVLAMGATRAAAAGAWLSPLDDRYEPGQTAVVIGYVPAAEVDMSLRYYGWLRVDPTAAYRDNTPIRHWPFVHPTDRPVGLVTVRGSLSHGWAAGMWRASLSFVVPRGLTPGPYQVVICDDPCTTGLGDVIDATIYVGVDPPLPVVREWPLDEPAIGLLSPKALVTGPGYVATAAQVRKGVVRPGAPAPGVVAPTPTPSGTPVTPPTSAGVPPRDEENADVKAGADRGRSGGGAGNLGPLPWIAAAGGAGVVVAILLRGPRRNKQVHGGAEPPPSSLRSGQRAAGASRWPGRAARL